MLCQLVHNNSLFPFRQRVFSDLLKLVFDLRLYKNVR